MFRWEVYKSWGTIKISKHIATAESKPTNNKLGRDLCGHMYLACAYCATMLPYLKYYHDPAVKCT